MSVKYTCRYDKNRSVKSVKIFVGIISRLNIQSVYKNVGIIRKSVKYTCRYIKMSVNRKSVIIKRSV